MKDPSSTSDNDLGEIRSSTLAIDDRVYCPPEMAGTGTLQASIMVPQGQKDLSLERSPERLVKVPGPASSLPPPKKS
jgi:hypothetical protein